MVRNNGTPLRSHSTKLREFVFIFIFLFLFDLSFSFTSLVSVKPLVMSDVESSGKKRHSGVFPEKKKKKGLCGGSRQPLLSVRDLFSVVV